MNIKLTTYLSIGSVLMGAVHVIATFTPIISRQLSVMDEGGQNAFTYMSLMCGMLLIFGGIVSLLLAPHTHRHPVCRQAFLVAVFVLAIAGILAISYMPSNPFAWIVFIITTPLLFLNLRQQ